ncbi:MAG: hypothetical protein J6S67_07630 [Methanobrevibacter sp.]|nr:hypothetical protein [Methanobrevibacter sp.]
MRRLFISIVNFFSKIINKFWWPHWSNLRWSKLVTEDPPLQPEDIITDIESLQSVCKRLYEKFVWAHDGIDELFDAVMPPPMVYKEYLDGSIIDDCDGFHSTLYHMVAKSGYRCFLLCVLAHKKGHCVLLCQINDKWYVCDYTRIYAGVDNPMDAINEYNAEYVQLYHADSDVFYDGLTLYDYDSSKFRSYKIGDIDA